MILAQSCIDNIGLLKKAAALFLYFSHFGFSLGLSEGKKPIDNGSEQEGSLGKAVGAWKIQSCCCPRQEAEAWTK